MHHERLKKLSQFLDEHFVVGSAPSKATIIKLIKDGDIDGRRIGKNWFIDMNKYNRSNNELVNQVLGT